LQRRYENKNLSPQGREERKEKPGLKNKAAVIPREPVLLQTGTETRESNSLKLNGFPPARE
jgi:hypothetical protein